MSARTWFREFTSAMAGRAGEVSRTSCHGRDCGQVDCATCAAIQAWYERLDGETDPPPDEPADYEAVAMTGAIDAWRDSPVTALVVRWLLPAVGEAMDNLVRMRSVGR